MNRLKSFLRKMGLFVAFVIVSLAVVVILMPKLALWYEIESRLEANKKIIVDGETVNDRWFDMAITSGKLYVGNLQLARIEMMQLSLWGLYNNMHLSNIFVGSQLKMLQGLHITQADISYLPLMNVRLKAEGNFGSLEGEIDLDQRKLSMFVQPKPWLQKQTMLMRQLHKKPQGYHFVWSY